MASPLFGAGVLGYDATHQKFQQRRVAKARRAARFSELEKVNAARIARLCDMCACEEGDHAAADHPGGGDQPMGDPEVDAKFGWMGKRVCVVIRMTSMQAVGGRGKREG